MKFFKLMARSRPKSRWFALAVVTLWFVPALVGCGGSQLPTVPVTGTISFAGRPLDGGQIVFQPIKPAAGQPNRFATGTIETSGRYAMSTFTQGDGALPGEYAVVVRGPAAPPPVDQYSKSAAPVPASPVPAIYSDAARTPLRAAIPADAGPQELDFDLETK